MLLDVLSNISPVVHCSKFLCDINILYIDFIKAFKHIYDLYGIVTKLKHIVKKTASIPWIIGIYCTSLECLIFPNKSISNIEITFPKLIATKTKRQVAANTFVETKQESIIAIRATTSKSGLLKLSNIFHLDSKLSFDLGLINHFIICISPLYHLCDLFIYAI